MDNFKNFAKVTVSTGYDAAATSIVLSGGHGAKLPTAPFNATWYNSTDFADPTDDPNVEIIRVTAIATDTLTVTRAQESTGASTKNTASKTYRMIAGLTAKTLNTDIGTGAGVVAQTANGRLTLETGVAVSLTNQSAKTSIYFTPYQGNCIALYDGSAWSLSAFTERTLALGTLVADKNYDVFVWNNAGTLTLELSAAWTTDIARADALVLQDGVYVKSGATTRRYIGTFRTTATTTTEDSLSKRFIWNNQNRIRRDAYVFELGSHVYATDVARIWNNNPANAFGFVTGLAEDTIAASATAALSAQATGVYVVFGIGLDGTTIYRAAEGYITYIASITSISNQVALGTLIAPQLGYHTVMLLERAGAGSGNFGVGYLYGVVSG